VAASVLVSGCASGGPVPDASPSAFQQTTRVAVVATADSEARWGQAARRLEAIAQNALATRRPDLRLVERRDLDRVLKEQALSLSGRVADETAVRVGRLLGADTLLVIRLDGPALVDLVLEPSAADLPPVGCVLKLLAVETGEVLWTVAIQEPVSDAIGWRWRDPWRAGA